MSLDRHARRDRLAGADDTDDWLHLGLGVGMVALPFLMADRQRSPNDVD